MKDLNLKVQFSKSGSPFIRTFQPVYLFKGEIRKGLVFANEERAKFEIKIYTGLGYRFMYYNHEIVFLS